MVYTRLSTMKATNNVLLSVSGFKTAEDFTAQVAFSRTLLELTGKEQWTDNVHQSSETLPASIYNYNIK